MDNLSENWGVPDWTNQEAYPKLDVSDRVWWWELTRRRPDYRELWTGAISKREVTDTNTVIADDCDWLRLNFEMSTILDPTKSF